MVPALMQAVLDHPDLANHDLSSLAYVMAASTAIPPPLLARVTACLGAVFYVACGSTEAGYVSRLRRSETRADGDERMTRRLSSVGQVLPWVSVVLLDDADRPVSDGEIGEICVRNYAFVEYWQDPVASAAARWGEGYVRTGDMGRFDEQGYLWVVDRKKDMIISGGENIFCREVENALHGHPSIQDVAVIGYPDEKWGESAMAVIVSRPGSIVAADDVVSLFCRTGLARYKCPKRIEVVEQLPMTAAGKVDKPALRRQWASPVLLQAET